jgi:site-specific DNA recombinase
MKPSTTTIRCVLYLRISLDRTGEGLAIGRQREACTRIALERRWVIVREYVDDSISAYKARARRPGYEEMTTDYAAGTFDAIVVWDLDRLTRKPRELEDWIDRAEGRGLLLVTANGECDLTTDAGKLFARIKAAVARSESDRKGARQVAAAAQRAERGYMPVGVRAFGWASDGTALEAPAWCEVATREEVSEAQIVREMFARFHSGDSLVGITRWLNRRGVPSRHGGPWHPNSVRHILVNPRYAGRVVHRRRNPEGPGPSFPGAFPALVDEAVFDAVGERLADPRRKTAFGTDRRHIGSSLYQCGVCGKAVRSTGARHRTSYRCPDGHVSRLAAAIDEFVTDSIRARLARGDDSGAALTAPAGPEATAAAAQVQTLRRRLTQAEQDYDDDLIDARRYKAKRAKIEAELDEAEARRAQLLAGAEVAGVILAPDPVRAYDDAPLGVQQAVIRHLATVTLRHVLRGTKGFDENTVLITPRE